MAILPTPFDASSVVRPNTFSEIPDYPAILRLKQRRQWVSWKYVLREGSAKPTKPPYQPGNGLPASHSNPSHWSTFDAAVGRATRSRMDGIGYVLTDDDGIIGIDLDNCRDPDTGDLDPWVQEIIDFGETYAEVSPSETGIRIIADGKLPASVKSDAAGVEIYVGKRYLTLTGWHVHGSPETINPAPRTIAALMARVEAIKPPAPVSAAPIGIQSAPLPASSGDTPFRAVNTAALRSLGAWVPDIFGSAARFQPATGAYRISSQSLGRALQEDLSIAPNGIVDFGVHDMGDARGGGRTPIDLVIEFGRERGPMEAALWLCSRLGRDPSHFGFGEKERFGAALASGLKPGVTADGTRFDPETGEVLPDGPKDEVEASPFEWVDPRTIPPRRWLYNRHMIRGFVSSTVAPGGVGKSALTMCEGLAIASGRPLLGVEPDEQCPVWIMNLEDPVDELYRRTLSIALHYSIPPEDLTGTVFINSGRDRSVIIGTTTKAGTIIARPVVESIKRQVNRHKIGLIIVDPFVSSHAVPENDNPAINAVVSAWREIAEETGCAIELVHHTRKTGGNEITVEDGRGGSALHGAVRSMRAINGMSKDEASEYGVDNHRLYFRCDAGKANLAPASDKSEWYHLASVDLGNATQDRPSDHVGVVTRWTPPTASEAIQHGDLEKVAEVIRGGVWRASAQCGNWAGYAVCQALGLDQSRKEDKAKAGNMLHVWIKSGALKIVTAPDATRQQRQFVEVG